ncbi:MAG TPA: serine protease [Acidimicrobiia bacterium]|nr:serine protease [Acidimicrobiia bacterium]
MQTERPRAAAPRGPERVAPGVDGSRRSLLPRTTIGIVTTLLAAAVGAALSGAILFAYYQHRLNGIEDKVERFTGAAEESVSEAIDEIESERDDARAQIRAELEPLQELQASTETLQDLVEKTKESVLFVSTRDPVGQPRAGSAFVVTSDADQSYLLTSLEVVRASTARPGPALVVERGEEQFEATLWTWDEQRDLALLVIPKGNLPRLEWAPEEPNLGIGQRVFAVAGKGGAGASIAQGFIADVSAAGVLHDTPVSGAFEGGPLINSKGEVVGVSSRAYAPLGFRSDQATYAPPIRAACAGVLQCPGGNSGGAPAGRR